MKKQKFSVALSLVYFGILSEKLKKTHWLILVHQVFYGAIL